MIEPEKDMPPPPPGGLIRAPGPAGPGEARQAALERIAAALEALHLETVEIRRLLARRDVRP